MRSWNMSSEIWKSDRKSRFGYEEAIIYEISREFLEFTIWEVDSGIIQDDISYREWEGGINDLTTPSIGL